jgi:hypothetical protein
MPGGGNSPAGKVVEAMPDGDGNDPHSLQLLLSLMLPLLFALLKQIVFPHKIEEITVSILVT